MSAATMTAADVERAIRAAWRIEQPRLITTLSRMLRDVSLAEELTQDSLLAALESWPATGVPDKPGAWLIATAKRRALDQFRRNKMLARKHEMLLHELEREQETMPDLDAALDDDFWRRTAAPDLHRMSSPGVARGPRGVGTAHAMRPDDG